MLFACFPAQRHKNSFHSHVVRRSGLSQKALENVPFVPEVFYRKDAVLSYFMLVPSSTRTMSQRACSRLWVVQKRVQEPAQLLGLRPILR